MDSHSSAQIDPVRQRYIDTDPQITSQSIRNGRRSLPPHGFVGGTRWYDRYDPRGRGVESVVSPACFNKGTELTLRARAERETKRHRHDRAVRRFEPAHS